MAVASTMSQDEDNNKDEHEHDMVMPGFRFHPTEEELIEFYLRRKVEGKRFNVELITFLDLYRYDPWELPGTYRIYAYIASLFHFSDWNFFGIFNFPFPFNLLISSSSVDII